MSRYHDLGVDVACLDGQIWASRWCPPTGVHLATESHTVSALSHIPQRHIA